MSFTEQQEQLLAFLVEHCPSRQIEPPEIVVSWAAVNLHWDQETATRIYEQLLAAGAIDGKFGNSHTITPQGASTGTKILQRYHQQDVVSATAKEKREKRRDLRLVLLGGIIGCASALLVVYIAHVLGWNK